MKNCKVLGALMALVVVGSAWPLKPITQPQKKNITHHKDGSVLDLQEVYLRGYGILPKTVILGNYQHYLQPDIRVKAQGIIELSGWHYDFGRKIEDSKRVGNYVLVIEKRKQHPVGLYRFDWGVKGQLHKKISTFFPYTWNIKKVQRKIIEAYKYARKHHCTVQEERNGRFSLTGLTKEGISIKMIIGADGRVVTVYPLWPK
jgi:hypothetical protein